MIIESEQFKDFFYVPTLDRVLVNRNGNVIDLKRNCCPLPKKSLLGYIVVNCDKRTHFLHRLLALTFIENPLLHNEFAVVNHIDGNKANNALSNLEWVNHSGNIKHAYDNGLRNDNKPVLVKNLLDDSIERFNSIHELARARGVNPSLIVLYLKDYNREKICWGHYSIIYENDQWPIVDKTKIGCHRNGAPRKVTVIDQHGNKESFPSLSLACKELNVSYGVTLRYIRHNKQRFINGRTISYSDAGI